MTMDRATAVVLALILAPFSLVIIVALIRGYAITVIFHREQSRRNRRDE